ncbi:MAG: c-type cytochrome [Planctomycetes bacterium]|nr:c-type cytochrome [Planctomycetota bacterium]
MRPSAFALVTLAFTPTLRAQNGDIQGEPQPPLPTSLVLPAAPPLSAADERATFRLPPDLDLELVASEPLIHTPVHAVFDARGRLWVVEMRNYMPDADGQGEGDPTGSIALLTDDDHDGRMDRRTTFLDHLVLPRSIAITHGGALIIAPPHLLFAVDEDDDGVADDVKIVDQGLDGLVSPEYGINGLLPTLDNAFANACTSWRYVFDRGQWKRERTAGGGQWGITKDDFGRLYFNGNSDPLRGDRIPSQLACRNPNAPVAPGVNVRVVDDLHVKPARINPGVNRGYKPGTLGPDWKLDVATGTCGPWIHRGDALPELYRGDAFVCEPCGNLVVRYELSESADGVVKGTPARNADGLDFLTSTDERFRPVNLFDGPDGALYVVDLYRGMIQHRLFATTWLRKQVDARGLAQPTDLGRIWRVKKKGAERKKPVELAALGSRELAKALASSNGWTRDTAQRLLVEAPGLESDARAELEKLLFEHVDVRARIHALWVFAAKNAIDAPFALRVLQSTDERFLAHAVRATEPVAASGAKEVVRRWTELAGLRSQVLLSLASVRGDAALETIAGLVALGAAEESVRKAALVSIGGREIEFLERVLAGGPEVNRRQLLRALGRAVAEERRAEDLERILVTLAEPRCKNADVEEVLNGLLDGLPKDEKGEPLPTFLPRAPTPLVVLVRSEDLGVSGPAGVLRDHALAWPGKPGAELFRVRTLTAEEQQRFAQGRELYAANCMACHQSSGRGDPALAPPLRSSPFVLGDETKLARILLHGLNGPIDVLGQRFDSDMPAFALTDAELAALATYVRREWGNTAEPVTAETFARIRKDTAERKPAWTVKELDALGR